MVRKRSKLYFQLASALLLSAISLLAQTQLDLKTQTRRVDFSGAPSTKPAKIGSILPSTCGLGDAFMWTSSAPGSNWYLCTGVNTWSLQGGGGGSGGSASDGILVIVSSATTLTIGGACTPLQPCNVRMGNNVFGVTGTMQAVTSGGDDTVFVYVTPTGVFTIGVSSAAIACTGGCVVASPITAFPSGSLPLARLTISGGVWQPGTDLQALLSEDGVLAGTGLTALLAGGVTTIGIDQSVVGLRVASPATSADACVTNSWSTDGTYLYICVASNSWKRVALATW